MNYEVYIIGAGSFAKKLAITLTKFPISLKGFIDEFAQGKLMSLPVYKACQVVTKKDTIFLSAISNSEYTLNAINRLKKRGISRSQIIPLYYDSCAVYLEATLSNDFATNIVKLANCKGEFENYEADTSPKPLNSDLLSVRLLSRGSLFLSHLKPVLNALDAHGVKYEIASDRFNSHFREQKIASQEMMLKTSSPLVLTSQFFDISPSHTVRLTFLHAIYDSMMFRESIFDTIDNPKHHYIAMPTEACMSFFAQKLEQKKLRNKVTLIPLGYPKLDRSIREYHKYQRSASSNQIIIYAPTQSLTPSPETPEGYSIYHAYEFLLTLIDKLPNHKLVIQPHPDDLVLLNESAETEATIEMKKLIRLTEEHPRVSLIDSSQPQLELFAKSQFLISDTSSTAYTYAFTTLKPVLFLSPNEKVLSSKWSHLYYIKDRKKIGVVCSNRSEIDDVIVKLTSNAKYYEKEIGALRQNRVYNLFDSEKHLPELISFLIDKSKNN